MDSVSVIEARGLTKLYGAHRGVDNLDLNVNRGEIFGYLGPNGAGKTTTIRMLLGFIRPSRGQLKLFGEKTGPGATHLRYRIGYLPGEIGLDENVTGEKLLMYYRRLSGGTAPNFDWLCNHLRFYPEERRRRVKKYSKGTKQKLGIIQALQHDPELIILDEPTSGLDPLAQTAFFEILQELRDRGRTIFFSTHVLTEVQRVCDRVGVVRDGKLVLDSTVSELSVSADRLLWVKMNGNAPANGSVVGAGAVPAIPKARFLRTESGGWLLYLVAPADAGRILQELAQLKPADFRFEPAFEESFLKLYGVKCAS